MQRTIHQLRDRSRIDFGEKVRSVASQLEKFEATESVSNTGTGTRREGADFEHLMMELWDAFGAQAVSTGARSSVVLGASRRLYTKLSYDSRSVFIPRSEIGTVSEQAPRWLEVSFRVEDLVASYPTSAEAIRKYAPETGRFAGESYPDLYRGSATRFDDTIVLVNKGVLYEKILLEYKTAKSSKGQRIDGNAHERLSFQIMQYLEVATRYTRCSLAVLANGAFIRYRNKYHVNFHIQAERLQNFSWFSMEYACTADQYILFLEGIHRFLFEGSSRR